MKGFKGLLTLLQAENKKIISSNDIEKNGSIIKFKNNFSGDY